RGDERPAVRQARTGAGASVDLHTAPSQFVATIGDVLMRWTTDRWLSTLHGLLNRPAAHASSGPRLSIAFFNHPNYDVLIECNAPAGQAAHPPVMSGDYRDLKYAKTGLTPATMGARGEATVP